MLSEFGIRALASASASTAVSPPILRNSSRMCGANSAQWPSASMIGCLRLARIFRVSFTPLVDMSHPPGGASVVRDDTPTRWARRDLIAARIAATSGRSGTERRDAMLPAPGFHHLHLNSVDPDAAIAFYLEQFPTSAKASWGGLPALGAPNDVLVLFTRVAAPPPTSPQTALWHFGWHVTDTRKSLDTYQSRKHVKLLPLYTTDD